MRNGSLADEKYHLYGFFFVKAMRVFQPGDQRTGQCLCIKTGKKAFEIIPLLSMLEIKGVVAKENGNSYVAIIKT